MGARSKLFARALVLPSKREQIREVEKMSGNPHKGDTSVEVGKEEYILCFDLNACANVMEHLGVENFEELADEKFQSKIGLKDIRYILWAGLQRHYPDLTEDDVGAMEWDMEYAANKLGEAFRKGLLREGPSKGPNSKKGMKRNRGAGKKRS